MHICSLKGACPRYATAIIPHRLQLPAVTFSRSMKVKIPLECARLLVLTYILYDGPKMFRFGALQERHLCPHVARDEAHPFPLRELPGLLYIKCLNEPDCTSLWCIDRRLQTVSYFPNPRTNKTHRGGMSQQAAAGTAVPETLGSSIHELRMSSAACVATEKMAARTAQPPIRGLYAEWPTCPAATPAAPLRLAAHPKGPAI